MSLAHNWVLNLDLRHVGALPTGSNLVHPHHLEFGTAASPLQLGPTGVETGRSVYVDGRWKF
jgi:hypothetical protein